MGLIASKQTFETQNETDDGSELPEKVTPKATRTLPFDPRSPSGNVSRTPITVSDKADENGTPVVRSFKSLPIDPRSPTNEVSDKADENGTPVVRSFKSLPIDPRSPTNEMMRTPLLVEDTNEKRKYQPLKPSKLAEISFQTSSCTKESNKDPRSPTEKVPRTPLEEGYDDPKNPLSLDHLNLEQNHPTEEEILKDPKINLSKKLFDSLDKDRRPLTDVQNKSSNQPKIQVQALQCRNVEEEFDKNEKQILNKIEAQDRDVKTSTEFVENI